MGGVILPITCSNCAYVDCTYENDKMCAKCSNHNNFIPAAHFTNSHDDGPDALINALHLIRETCKKYYDERIGCSNCPLRGDSNEDICGVGYFNKPSSWKLKCDEKQDNRLFK